MTTTHTEHAAIDLDAPARRERQGIRTEVLRDLRFILSLAAIMGTVMLGLISVQLHDLNRGVRAATAPTGNAIPVAAHRVQLQITGDPYAEAIGHIAYMDGSEAEYAPGVYSVTALAGARIELTADSGFSTCRITVDGNMVSERTAVNQQTVTCHWEAE